MEFHPIKNGLATIQDRTFRLECLGFSRVENVHGMYYYTHPDYNFEVRQKHIENTTSLDYNHEFPELFKPENL